MQEILARFEQLFSHIKEYVDNRITTIKLSIAEKVSKLIAGLLAAMVAIFFILLFVVFAGVGLAYIIAKWTGEVYAGFLIVGFLFLLLGIIIWFAKEKLLRIAIMNVIIKAIFSDKDDEV
ncbi:phage holin family protein [Ferruginibacter albus]|uniref:phage holin family protein n=1 Tax=Ferruginibacter albus TaxID=2875540 RepID=UPI001CC58684|nr:phage holin family protein [Ferruginibacter albus]UAY53149.1 phage holin family protein [Ferruginibacter albus]